MLMLSEIPLFIGVAIHETEVAKNTDNIVRFSAMFRTWSCHAHFFEKSPEARMVSSSNALVDCELMDR
jgi:hypothetical protein